MCVFDVFFPHTGQHQPHDLVMTQGSMAARTLSSRQINASAVPQATPMPFII